MLGANGISVAEVAERVATVGLFDLDDLGPLVTQQAGTERGRDAGTQIQHPQPVQRSSAHSCSFVSRCSAKTSFIEPFAWRASSASSAVRVLCIQWWAMKW